MGAPMPEVSLRARKAGPQRFVHKGLCEILVSLGVFGLLGPKAGTEQHKGAFVHKGLYENRQITWKEAFAVTPLFSSSIAVGFLLLIMISVHCVSLFLRT